MSTNKKLLIVVIIAVALACAYFLTLDGQASKTGSRVQSGSCGGSYNYRLDGHDAAANLTVYDINLWASSNLNGKPAAVARHGDSVCVLDDNGDRVQVMTESGKKGWLSSIFLKAK